MSKERKISESMINQVSKKIYSLLGFQLESVFGGALT